jgi:hypothetical protein
MWPWDTLNTLFNNMFEKSKLRQNRAPNFIKKLHNQRRNKVFWKPCKN